LIDGFVDYRSQTWPNLGLAKLEIEKQSTSTLVYQLNRVHHI